MSATQPPAPLSYAATGQQTQAHHYPYRRCADQDSNTPVRHPVVVVGAGPVGLSLAIDLAHRWQPVVLLDNDHKLSTGSRANCFAQRTLSLATRDRYRVAGRTYQSCAHESSRYTHRSGLACRTWGFALCWPFNHYCLDRNGWLAVVPAISRGQRCRMNTSGRVDCSNPSCRQHWEPTNRHAETAGARSPKPGNAQETTGY